MSADKYDVIIVGAGLAGLSAAYKIAQAGLEVVLVERGPYPGSKNLSGGILYSRILEQIIPDFGNTAPVERFITNYYTSMVTADDYFNLEYKSRALGVYPYNAVSVLRSKFDRWLGEKAEEAGAMIIPGIKVDKVIKKDNQVVGIRAGTEEIFADVVIAADGINSFISREAGLRGEIKPEHLAVGVKALIELPRETIEERFKLSGNEGAAYSILGEATHGVAGGAFLYTNLETISVGVVMRLDDLVKQKVKPHEVLDDLLQHPLVAPLVKGGRMTEYGAHLTAEGGINMVPSKLYENGIMIVGDAAGLTINSGLVIRGMDLAIGSGLAAAETVIEAKNKGDYSSNSLGSYQRRLEESFIMKDLKLYAKLPEFMESELLFKKYPLMINSLFNRIYTQDLTPKEHMYKTVLKVIKESRIPILGLVKDIYKGVRAL